MLHQLILMSRRGAARSFHLLYNFLIRSMQSSRKSDYLYPLQGRFQMYTYAHVIAIESLVLSQRSTRRCEKGVLTDKTQDLLLQVLTDQYLLKLETWRKAVIAQVSVRICESRRTQSHRFNPVRHKSFIHLCYAAIW